MPKKMTRMRAVNQQFLARIKPEFESWGLLRHPRENGFFGGTDHGYRYDFADLRDRTNIRLASFGIHQPDASLWIRGYNAGLLEGEEKDLLILFDNIKDLFVLAGRWSILRPLSVAFSLPSTSKRPPIDQANELITKVERQLPKLKDYLYGK